MTYERLCHLKMAGNIRDTFPQIIYPGYIDMSAHARFITFYDILTLREFATKGSGLSATYR